LRLQALIGAFFFLLGFLTLGTLRVSHWDPGPGVLLLVALFLTLGYPGVITLLLLLHPISRVEEQTRDEWLAENAPPQEPESH
jgi:hypothetical protein